MVSKRLLIGAVFISFSLCFADKTEDRIVRLTTTENTSNYEILYLSVSEADKKSKTVAVILSHSEEQQLVYAYEASEEATTLKLHLEDKNVTDKIKAPNTIVTTVRVTKAQYKRAKKIIKSHIKTLNTIDSPEIRFYNCICEVLKACDMKIPYRSPYRPPNLTQWVGDIPAYSRDLVLKE